MVIGPSTPPAKTPMPDEPARTAHAPLIDLYRQTGLFAWWQGLSRLGARSPVRVVFIIDACLCRPEPSLLRAVARTRPAPGATSPPLNTPLSVPHEVLTQALELFGQSPLRPWSTPSGAPLPAEADWDPLDAMSELMAVEMGPQALRWASQKLHSKGLAVPDDELHDLAALFANLHLRGAVGSFDPAQGEGHEGAWLGTVFYRYALRQVLATRHTVALADWLETADVPDPAGDPPRVLEQRAQQEWLAAVPRLLGALPRLQRQALALYYGFEGREHTVAEVARALDTNGHFARAALVSGLGALAAASGASGLLTPPELALARALFLESRPVEQIARQRGEPVAEVRRIVSALTQKLQTGLRRRTRLPRLDSPARLPAVPSTSTLASTPMPPAHLPECPTAGSDITVSAWTTERLSFPTAQPQTSEQAAAPFVPLSPPPVPARQQAPALQPPVARPPSPVSTAPAAAPRADLPPDHAEWLQLLDTAARHSQANLAPWLELFKERATAQGLDLNRAMEPPCDDAAWLWALDDGAAAVVAALEDELPRAARRSPPVWLVVEGLSAGNTATARWKAAGWQGPALPLQALLRQRLNFVSGMSSQAAELAAQCALTVLAERATPLLPGLLQAPGRADPAGTLRLLWQDPVHSETPMAAPLDQTQGSATDRLTTQGAITSR